MNVGVEAHTIRRADEREDERDAGEHGAPTLAVKCVAAVGEVGLPKGWAGWGRVIKLMYVIYMMYAIYMIYSSEFQQYPLAIFSDARTSLPAERGPTGATRRPICPPTRRGQRT